MTDDNAEFRRGYLAGHAAGYREAVKAARAQLDNMPLTRVVHEEEAERIQEVTPDAPFWVLNFSVRTYDLLRRYVTTVGDLINLTVTDLEDMRGFGRKTIDEILSIVHSHGYQLKGEPPNI